MEIINKNKLCCTKGSFLSQIVWSLPDFMSHVSVPTYAEFLTRGVSEGWGHDACLCSPAWSWMRKLLSCLVQHTSPLFSVVLDIIENSFYQPCYTINSEQSMCWKCIVIGKGEKSLCYPCYMVTHGRYVCFYLWTTKFSAYSVELTNTSFLKMSQ